MARVVRDVGKWSVALLVVLAGAGCLVTNTVTEPDRDCSQQCAVEPTELIGSRQPGERCTYAQECVPVCCDCGGSKGETVLLASCRLGLCMARKDICGLKNVGTLCSTRDKQTGCNQPLSGLP